MSGPLTTSGIGQIKTGPLALNTDGIYANALLIPSGNVGIGTVSPLVELHVKATAGNADIGTESVDGFKWTMSTESGSGSWVLNRDIPGTLPTIVALRSGNVGIGTVNPVDKLDVNGAIHAYGTASGSRLKETFMDYCVGGGCGPVGYGRIVATGPDATTYGTFSLQLYNGNGDALYPFTVIDNGNVGINTGQTAPTEKLDVNGNVKVSGNIITSGSGGSTYGAITLKGSKGTYMANTWSGINFKDTQGVNAGTLMMSADYSGFFNRADNEWRWLVDDSGTTNQHGNSNVGGNIIVGKNVGIGTATPNPAKGASGYLDVADVYLRSTGKWVSEGVAATTIPCNWVGQRYVGNVTIGCNGASITGITAE